jgi:hypothetical protein
VLPQPTTETEVEVGKGLLARPKEKTKVGYKYFSGT